MYRITFAEDDPDTAKQLRTYIEQYSEEKGKVEILEFHDGSTLLENYTHCDVLLLDIEMPGIDGMEAARQIRKLDETVAIVFITNMAQYAIQGYEVNAFDFVLKPISYYTLSMRLTRALKRARANARKEILLSFPGMVKKVKIEDIYYVEVQNKMLHYYTAQGEITVRGSLKSAQELLAEYPFAKCSYWYMVNLMYVSGVEGNYVSVGKYQLEVSRRNRTALLKALTAYVGGREQ